MTVAILFTVRKALPLVRPSGYFISVLKKKTIYLQHTQELGYDRRELQLQINRASEKDRRELLKLKDKEKKQVTPGPLIVTYYPDLPRKNLSA